MSRSFATASSVPSVCGSTDTPWAMRSTVRCAISARCRRRTSESASNRARNACGLLESLRDFFQDLLVGAPDEYADLVQPRQIVGDGLETANEEVTDGDVGPRRAGQHLPQPLQQRGIGGCVEDVQKITPMTVILWLNQTTVKQIRAFNS